MTATTRAHLARDERPTAIAYDSDAAALADGTASTQAAPGVPEHVREVVA
ncbi:hypothetical protein [Promicromonospora xylanilytica]